MDHYFQLSRPQLISVGKVLMLSHRLSDRKESILPLTLNQLQEILLVCLFYSLIVLWIFISHTNFPCLRILSEGFFNDYATYRTRMEQSCTSADQVSSFEIVEHKKTSRFPLLPTPQLCACAVYRSDERSELIIKENIRHCLVYMMCR